MWGPWTGIRAGPNRIHRSFGPHLGSQLPFWAQVFGSGGILRGYVLVTGAPSGGGSSLSIPSIPFGFPMKKSIFVAVFGCVASLTMVDMSVAQG